LRWQPAAIAIRISNINAVTSESTDGTARILKDLRRQSPPTAGATYFLSCLPGGLGKTARVTADAYEARGASGWVFTDADVLMQSTDFFAGARWRSHDRKKLDHLTLFGDV